MVKDTLKFTALWHDNEVGRLLKMKARQTDQPTERSQAKKLARPASGARDGRTEGGCDTCRDTGGGGWTNRRGNEDYPL